MAATVGAGSGGRRSRLPAPGVMDGLFTVLLRFSVSQHCLCEIGDRHPFHRVGPTGRPLPAQLAALGSVDTGRYRCRRAVGRGRATGSGYSRGAGHRPLPALRRPHRRRLHERALSDAAAAGCRRSPPGRAGQNHRDGDRLNPATGRRHHGGSHLAAGRHRPRARPAGRPPHRRRRPPRWRHRRRTGLLHHQHRPLRRPRAASLG